MNDIKPCEQTNMDTITMPATPQSCFADFLLALALIGMCQQGTVAKQNADLLFKGFKWGLITEEEAFRIAEGKQI